MTQEKDKLIARRARIHPGLVLAYTLFVSLLVVVGALWTFQIHDRIEQDYALLDRSARKIQLAERMQTAILRRLTDLHEAFASTDPFERDARIQDLYHQAANYRSARDALLKLLDTPAERALIARIDEAARQAEPATNDVADMIQGDASASRIRTALIEARKVREEMTRLLGQLVELERQINTITIAEARARLQHFSRFTIVISALVVLFSLLLALITRRTVEGQHQSMAKEALTDPLTGLPNRRCVMDQLEEAVLTARQGEPHALLYLDLNRFKPINDYCGHEAGDDVLRMLARLWSSKLRQSDLLGRIGGDEFVVLLRHARIDAARSIATDLVLLTEHQSFTCKGRSFPLGVSIGVAPIDGQIRDARAILRAADNACYRAKADKGDSISFAEPLLANPRQPR